MKNYLAKKWLGPIILLVYTLLISLYISAQLTPHLKEVFPVIAREAGNFLPITIQNGEIIQPTDTVISKDYTTDGKTIHVVLDTRTDMLNINELPGEGMYLSKKCFYMVSREESKVRCFDPNQTLEPIEITDEMVQNIVSIADEYIGTFMTSVLFIFLAIGFYIIILFYTVIMHWIVALFYKTTFWQTLFVNTQVYLLLNLLETLASTDINFFIHLILFISINILICKGANDRKKAEKASN